MNALTYFEAYEGAQYNKEKALEGRRGDHYRIAVDTDRYARKWQRAERQVRKFGHKIRVALGDPDQYRTCVVCGLGISEGYGNTHTNCK